MAKRESKMSRKISFVHCEDVAQTLQNYLVNQNKNGKAHCTLLYLSEFI